MVDAIYYRLHSVTATHSADFKNTTIIAERNGNIYTGRHHAPYNTETQISWLHIP